MTSLITNSRDATIVDFSNAPGVSLKMKSARRKVVIVAMNRQVTAFKILRSLDSFASDIIYSWFANVMTKYDRGGTIVLLVS